MQGLSPRINQIDADSSSQQQIVNHRGIVILSEPAVAGESKALWAANIYTKPALPHVETRHAASQARDNLGPRRDITAATAESTNTHAMITCELTQ